MAMYIRVKGLSKNTVGGGGGGVGGGGEFYGFNGRWNYNILIKKWQGQLFMKHKNEAMFYWNGMNIFNYQFPIMISTVWRLVAHRFQNNL